MRNERLHGVFQGKRGGSLNEPKPTPYELASLAALLASLEKDAKVTSLEGFIPQALRLWQDAVQFLKQPYDIPVGRILGYEAFSFETVLKPIEPAAKGQKKFRTMVG